jgi:hypothetical protein
MAFGDSGQWRVVVNGVPFRADGNTYEEAEQKVWDMLDASQGSLFDVRARSLGLSDNDVEALRLGDEVGDFVAANRGRVDAKGSTTGAANRFWIGMGAQFSNRWHGFRQLTQEMFGTEAAAKAIQEEQADEQALFAELDKLHVGAEDVGELGADVAALLGLAGAGAYAATAAGVGAATGGVAASGVIPSAASGALLAASSLQEDATLTSRLIDAGIGAAGAAVGPILSKVGGAAGGLISKLRPGVSVKVPGAWLRFMGLAGRPGATANVIDDSLVMMASTDPGKQAIGRAALDRVQQIVARLPSNATRGLKDEALFGTLRQAVQKATVPTTSGVNVFDGAIFEREAAQLLGQLGNMFEKPQQQLMAASIGTLAKGLQGLPEEVATRAAARAAVALTAAPAESAAFKKALELATNPSVREQMIDGLADIGQRVLSDAPKNAVASFMRGTGFAATDESSDQIEEMLD